MMELLAPYSNGLIILAIELTVVLFLLVIGFLVYQVKQSKQSSKTANQFVKKLQSGEDDRRQVLLEKFGNNLGMEGDELETKVQEFLDKETAFYKTLLTVFLSKDSKFLEQAYDELNGVMDDWSGMVPEGIIGEGEIEELTSNIIKLKEDNARLSGELKENHDEMESLMAEYNAAFNKTEEQRRKNAETAENDAKQQSDSDSKQTVAEDEPSAEESYDDASGQDELDVEIALSGEQTDSDIPAAVSTDDIDNLFNEALDSPPRAEEDNSKEGVQLDAEDQTPDETIQAHDEMADEAPTNGDSEAAQEEPPQDDDLVDQSGAEASDGEAPATAAEAEPVPAVDASEIDDLLELGDAEVSADQATAAVAEPESAVDATEIDDLLDLGDAEASDVQATAAIAEPEPAVDANVIDDLLELGDAEAIVDQATAAVAEPEPAVDANEIDDLLDLGDAEASVDQQAAADTEPEPAVDATEIDEPLDLGDTELSDEQSAAAVTEPEPAVDATEIDDILDLSIAAPPITDEADESSEGDAQQPPPSATEQLIDNLDFDLSRSDDDVEFVDITAEADEPAKAASDDDFLDITRAD